MTALATVSRASHETGRVGPNAVLQLIDVMREHEDAGLTGRVFDAAGLTFLLTCPPSTMVDERIPAALFCALWQELPADVAARIARKAGRRTADYIVANRIPGLAARALYWSPPRLAAPLLLKAIEKHAWTFAGSGHCRTRSRPGIVIDIRDNPLAMQGCVWHVAVFERLFHRLIAPGMRVRHTACCLAGGEHCRFESDI